MRTLRLPFLSAVAVIGLVSTGLTAAEPSQALPVMPLVQHPHTPLQPFPKSAVLNEVLFNEQGADSVSGGEYVELIIRSQQNLGGYSVQDLAGTWNVSLPAQAVPGGTYILILLGNYVPPDFNQSFAQAGSRGHVAIAAGIPVGDHLSNTSGGVQLLRGPDVIDEVSWGVAGSPAGANPATLVDISYPTRPIRPGDSIGLNARSTSTGGSGDWDRRGGPNAAGPTPSVRNIVSLPDAASLNVNVHALVNHLAGALSLETARPGWLQISHAQVTSTTVTQGNDWIEVRANHDITLKVKDFGAPKSLTGEVVARYERSTVQGLVRHSLSITGSVLSTDGYGFDLNHLQVLSGFHTNIERATCTNSYAWRELGQPYPYTIAGTLVATQTGLNSWNLSDTRDCTDWGGAGVKHSTSSSTTTEVADGTFDSTTTVTRPWEMGPPLPSDHGSQTISGTATMNIDAICQLTPQGMTTEFSRFDVFLDETLTISLQKLRHGTLSQSIATDTLGTVTVTGSMSLPVTRAGFDFELGSVIDGTVSSLGGKLIVQGTYQVLADGSPVATSTFYMDPPLPLNSGSGGGVGGLMDAAASCATVGAGIGSGIGVVGGAIVGGVAGSAAGGIGALPGVGAGAVGGAAVGAGLGGYYGALGCGLAYLCGWW